MLNTHVNSYLVRKEDWEKKDMERDWKWKLKIWTKDRSNNVHTQRTPFGHRATLHRKTRTTQVKALAEIYTTHSIAPFSWNLISNLNFLIKKIRIFWYFLLILDKCSKKKKKKNVRKYCQNFAKILIIPCNNPFFFLKRTRDAYVHTHIVLHAARIKDRPW